MAVDEHLLLVLQQQQKTPGRIVPAELDDHAATEASTSPTSEAATLVVRPCHFFLNNSNCSFGDCCRFPHSWIGGARDFCLVTELEGFEKPFAGIAYLSGSSYLITSSMDTVNVLDLQSRSCFCTWDIARFADLSTYSRSRISCLVGADKTVFVGVTGYLKIWSPLTGVMMSLDTSGGPYTGRGLGVLPLGREVGALALGKVNGYKFLFAGLTEGSILVWRWNSAGKVFERATDDNPFLFGAHRAHRLAITSLVLQGERLYSGSMDHTIKVWNLNPPSIPWRTSLHCLKTLIGHKDAVTSLLYWGQFLLSGSLDRTVRVWDSIQLEPIYTHTEACRVVALSGMKDAGSRPVLMCCGDDFTVYLYELPSFAKRGYIFSRNEVRHIVAGPEGLFFTGNSMGDLKMWKWGP